MSIAADSFLPIPDGMKANPNRKLEIEVLGETYLRLPIRTPIVERETNLLELVKEHAVPLARPGDVLFISEKVVAITQGRAVRETELRIGLTARILWRFVARVPYGIGLRRPSSMQCAVNECGALRIWAAAVIGALGKLAGRKGDFYRVAGPQAATIDAASTSPLQPDCVIMGPENPEGVAEHLFAETSIACAIVDVNDIGGSWVLGSAGVEDNRIVEAALKDNPLGQNDECTPMGILRRAKD